MSHNDDDDDDDANVKYSGMADPRNGGPKSSKVVLLFCSACTRCRRKKVHVRCLIS